MPIIPITAKLTQKQHSKVTSPCRKLKTGYMRERKKKLRLSRNLPPQALIPPPPPPMLPKAYYI
ncbi:hypothetical protein, unlikely [Trypanosoma brucei brucei TREU927]|uniref:Uncharacterized protein n=1 Tax=Trypanosoma brucei brucei (strain 927/4 GUTat10.1) TaxID=185431 RepID=Q38DT5_TRYB2|nr:hypothetical protein, unlikely [Trypanosoma brucei brucei TREU927]EAN77035.1 hypothetical protein, unlikely [Trypanosoma brucei brucei TREU927]